MPNEYDIWRRSIVYVMNYFDDSADVPWNYVQRTGDGRYEAVASYLRDNIDGPTDDGNYGEAYDHSVGIFPTESEAVDALRAHVREASRADREDWASQITLN